MGCSAKPKKLYLEKLFSTYHPRKLYCGLRVEFNQVTLHVWQSGRKLPPTKYQYTFTEFLSNKFMLDLINFPLDILNPGNEWVSQMLSLVTGKSTSLTEMPETFLMDLAQQLTITDLLNLSSTCKYFHKFFSTDEIWEPIFEKCLRCICTFVDYDQGQKMGGFKCICQQICVRAFGNNQTQNLLKNENFPIGSSSGKIFVNFTSNKPKEDYLHVDSHLNFLGDSELQEDSKQDTLKMNSSSHIRSEIEIASHSYFGVPNNSTLSVYQQSGSGEELGEVVVKGKTDPEADIKTSSSYTSVQDKNDMIFTRRDMRRRLRNLMLKTKKFECNEDCLPGDKTVKYALKYREDEIISS